jgi:dolichol-phosphate mannosyltransferase
VSSTDNSTQITELAPPESGRRRDFPIIAVVIPCYRVKAHILDVIARIGPEAQKIYVIDDCCPEKSGQYVRSECRDPRVEVVFHDSNRGVGGATITGYRRAVEAGAAILVKIDGDGQMDPVLLPRFVAPILRGEADYSKGNRFYNVEDLRTMPFARFFGNAGLSFFSKLSTGYWLLFDPTNGYTAIHAAVFRSLPVDKIDKRYFFESDMLFRLNLLRAVVVDIPMTAVYGSEKSSLSITHATFNFFLKHLANMGKRLVYNYIIRDFSIATLELIFGLSLLTFGIFFGLTHWYVSYRTGQPATSGTVMLSALPIFLGIQFLLGFLSFDIANQPRTPICPRLETERLFEIGPIR